LTERRLLQIAVALGSLVPIIAGGAGILSGLAMVDGSGSVSADSHFRYLSGLLFGIGVAFVTTIPGIERHTGRFRVLAGIVVAGGIGRLVSLLMRGAPDTAMLAALAMELVVTPALALWQARVAGQFS
jgi:hypothetical protein